MTGRQLSMLTASSSGSARCRRDIEASAEHCSIFLVRTLTPRFSEAPSLPSAPVARKMVRACGYHRKEINCTHSIPTAPSPNPDLASQLCFLRPRSHPTSTDFTMLVSNSETCCSYLESAGIKDMRGLRFADF